MKSRFNVANLYRAALKDRKTDKFFADLQEGIDEGHVTGGDFSVQELFEATVTDEMVHEAMAVWDSARPFTKARDVMRVALTAALKARRP